MAMTSPTTPTISNISNISAEVDPRQLLDLVRQLDGIKRGVEKVLSRSINKIAVMARTKLLAMIVKEVRVPKKYLRAESIKLRRASYSRLWASLEVRSKRIPLSQFSAQQVNEGVSYSIRKGVRKTLPHSFFATMPSGHVGVFRRYGPRVRVQSNLEWKFKGKGYSRKNTAKDVGKSRQRIQEAFGPSVPQVLFDASDYATGTFNALIQEKLTGEIDVQLGLMLAKNSPELEVAAG